MDQEKIAIFYHVYQCKDWENLFYNQINSLIISGLYHACDLIYIGINGDKELPINLPKFKVHYNLDKSTENDTLKSLYEFCVDNQDHKVMYFHTKGVTTNWLYIAKWRYYLEYFIIHRWEDCVKELNSNDVVGTEYLTYSTLMNHDTGEMETESNHHYSGNFWWANSSYIIKLDPNYLSLTDKGWLRYRSEFWIGTKNPKALEFYNSLMDKGGEYENITPLDYVNKNHLPNQNPQTNFNSNIPSS